MNAKSRLHDAISKQTDIDPIALADEVLANFFDDRLGIVGDILKHESDPATLGKIMIASLKETIAEVVRAEESLEPDDSPGRLRRDFDRNELR